MANWKRWTCIHGITEELDYHTCDECQKIAKKYGKEVKTTGPMVHRQTYIFTSQGQVNKLKKEYEKSK